MIAEPTDSQSKVSATSSSTSSSPSSPSSPSSSSSSSADNMFYYSPESYGKTNHKNHKTNSYAYLYPSSSSTSTTTTTTTSTTPSPKTSSNRFGEFQQKGFSDSGPPYSQPYNQNDKHSSDNYNYEETPEDEEEPAYYDSNEEPVTRKYYYPKRQRPKHYPIHDYYGSDLSSMSTTNEDSKIKSINSGVNYGAEEETDIGHNIKTYEGPSGGGGGRYGGAGGYGGGYSASGGSGGSTMRFPSKYYGSGTGAYYPTYYSSQYPIAGASEGAGSSFFGGDLLNRSSGWFGPGLAGVLLGLGLPLGILMASMLPALVSVPGIINTATVGRRKRFIPEFDLLSLNNTNLILNSGVLEILSKYGMPSLEDPQCLTEMFCTFASEGRNAKKNLIQTLIYHLIDLTPQRLAKWLTLDTLFNAVKDNKCEPIYKCMSSRVRFKDTERYDK